MNEWKNAKTMANKAGSNQPMSKGLARLTQSDCIGPVGVGEDGLCRRADPGIFLANALISRPGIQIKKNCDTVLPR